jgi:hypothetical protein
MATLYPLVVNGFKLFVNPTKMEVRKRAQINEVRTMAGTTFLSWPDLPDEVVFDGMTWGRRAISELRGLARAIERNPDTKEVTLVYKHSTYKGYVRDFTISADANNPRQYTYKFTFVVKSPRFKSDSMPIGNLDGYKAEFDFFSAQLQQASSEIASMPYDVFNNASAVYGQIFGKTGAKEKGLGLFIGRPRGLPF